jgi:hypothetical protein
MEQSEDDGDSKPDCKARKGEVMPGRKKELSEETQIKINDVAVELLDLLEKKWTAKRGKWMFISKVTSMMIILAVKRKKREEELNMKGKKRK